MKLVEKTHRESAMHFRMRGGCKEHLCNGAAESRDVDVHVTQAREVSMWGSVGHRVQEGEESWKSIMKPHKGSERVALMIGRLLEFHYFCSHNHAVHTLSLSVLLFVTPWTAAGQAPPSMRFPRQEYSSGCHFLLQKVQLLSEKWNE